MLRPAVAAVCLALLLSLRTSAVPAGDFQPEEGFASLFDGKTFKGWEGNLKMFRVEDGAIVAGTHKAPIPNNEFLCTTKKYRNFELRLQVRMIGKGQNAGVQFRSERIPNHHEVIGYQADIGVIGDNHLIWGALYDESRRRKFLVEGDQARLKEAVKPDGWNDVIVRAEGPKLLIKVAGVTTCDYTEQDAGIADTGVIALQIHGGGPAEASYRHIRIKELP